MPYESSLTRSHVYDLTDYDEWSGRCWLTSDRALTSLVLSGTNRRCEPGICCFPPGFHQDNQFSSITSRWLLLLHFPVDLTACPLQLAFVGPPWRSLVFHLLLVLSKP